MSKIVEELQTEIAHLNRMVEEFRRLYLLFDESGTTELVEPEDLEVCILSFTKSDLLVNKTRYFEEVVLLCEKLGMLDSIPKGLSDLEAVKTFIKSTVRAKKRAEKENKEKYP